MLEFYNFSFALALRFVPIFFLITIILITRMSQIKKYFNYVYIL